MLNRSPAANFNCTIQELKRIFIIEAKYGIALFQLHHTGIKTIQLNLKLSDLFLYFNCTIQELKPTEKSEYDVGVLISIAPYRN